MPAKLYEGPAPNQMTANVEVVEHMGSELYVYLTNNGTTLTARFPAEADVQPSQNVEVVFDPDNLHLFDQSSGNAIGHSKSAVA
jgi:multiple sugar transport system ATP-binding protein